MEQQQQQEVMATQEPRTALHYGPIFSRGFGVMPSVWLSVFYTCPPKPYTSDIHFIQSYTQSAPPQPSPHLLHAPIYSLACLPFPLAPFPLERHSKKRRKRSHLIPSTSSAAAGGASSSSPPATIPAFPEQSDVSTVACPLDPPADLLPSVSAACGASDGSLPSRSRCCPTLNAWILAAYSASALAAHPLPSSGYDLPALPDDSEACIGGVERALRDRGVDLPRVNGTCDAAYCYCGVRLRRLACAGAFVADAAEERWVPAGDAGRRLERDCSRFGFAGCTRCLRSLNQLKSEEKRGIGNATKWDKKAGPTQDRECQLMGVTWLLSKNRTHFLPAATSVLRVLMAADGIGGPDPTSCTLSLDDMPLAVGSDQIDSRGGSSAVRSLHLFQLFLMTTFVLFALFHV
ncbi:hypothetical protein C4D60_Mb06t10170 [Musa balbisiana]|uniref:SPARK domain-containing protein n=1 Tax=Musa balbisiana TaxID=52838 RepID=A0A4V6T436_MUSBA|nr:hypothetical protein C4D60_Mb06t10170 [Musa balbisiana]